MQEAPPRWRAFVTEGTPGDGGAWGALRARSGGGMHEATHMPRTDRRRHSVRRRQQRVGPSAVRHARASALLVFYDTPEQQQHLTQTTATTARPRCRDSRRVCRVACAVCRARGGTRNGPRVEHRCATKHTPVARVLPCRSWLEGPHPQRSKTAAAAADAAASAQRGERRFRRHTRWVVALRAAPRAFAAAFRACDHQARPSAWCRQPPCRISSRRQSSSRCRRMPLLLRATRPRATRQQQQAHNEQQPPRHAPQQRRQRLRAASCSWLL